MMDIIDELDEDDPLWLVNEQIKGLMEGDGASEDHDDVIAFLRQTGLPTKTVCDIHEAIVNAKKKSDDSKRLRAIRELCGYVEDGSCESVTIFQDDATRDWFIMVGAKSNRQIGYIGTSFNGVLDEIVNEVKYV